MIERRLKWTWIGGGRIYSFSSHTHTHTHTHAHIRTHAPAQPASETYTHTHMSAYTHAQTHAPMYVSTHTRMRVQNLLSLSVPCRPPLPCHPPSPTAPLPLPLSLTHIQTDHHDNQVVKASASIVGDCDFKPCRVITQSWRLVI